VTTTTEKVHGLLRLEGEDVTVQWRLDPKTDYLGAIKSHTDEEIEPVREVTIPLCALAGATVYRPWWRFWSGPQIVVLASDLQALETIVG
jgi:hypothetical protein